MSPAALWIVLLALAVVAGGLALRLRNAASAAVQAATNAQALDARSRAAVAALRTLAARPLLGIADEGLLADESAAHDPAGTPRADPAPDDDARPAPRAERRPDPRRRPVAARPARAPEPLPPART